MNETLPRMVLSRVERFDDRPAMRRKVDGRYQDISWQQLDKQVRAFAQALLALGLLPDQQAAIMAPNCPEWAFADLAIMAVGGRTVPVYHTEGLKTIIHILVDAEVRLLFTHSRLLALDLMKQREQMPQLKKIILLEGTAEETDILSLRSFSNSARRARPNSWKTCSRPENVNSWQPSSIPPALPASPRGRCSPTPTSSPILKPAAS